MDSFHGITENSVREMRARAHTPVRQEGQVSGVRHGGGPWAVKWISYLEDGWTVEHPVEPHKIPVIEEMVRAPVRSQRSEPIKYGV